MRTVTVTIPRSPKAATSVFALPAVHGPDSSCKSSSRTAPLTTATDDSEFTQPNTAHETQQLLVSIERQLAEVRRQHAALVSQLQEFAVDLALAVAETLVQYEVKHSTKRIQQVVSSVLQDQSIDVGVTVVVNRRGKELLQRSVAEEPGIWSHIELRVDESLSDGDCRVECHELQLESDWKRQWNEIKNRIEEYWNDAQTH
ncbi:MAG TPA: FliH/SctL family protein [Pirellulaceae bacterium]|nr:FliH/SctL family protein [Pirellulaceae bacterium]